MLDPDKVLNSVGGHALRVTGVGDIEVLMMTPDEKTWEDITDLELVSMATGKPVRKN